MAALPEIIMEHCKQHSHQGPKNRSFWTSPKSILGVGAVALLGYFLLTGHSQHVLNYLPYAFLLMCPLMHFFMHGSHKHDMEDHAKPVVVKSSNS